jgi:hypothetical protein
MSRVRQRSVRPLQDVKVVRDGDDGTQRRGALVRRCHQLQHIAEVAHGLSVADVTIVPVDVGFRWLRLSPIDGVIWDVLGLASSDPSILARPCNETLVSWPGLLRSVWLALLFVRVIGR